MSNKENVSCEGSTRERRRRQGQLTWRVNLQSSLFHLIPFDFSSGKTFPFYVLFLFSRDEGTMVTSTECAMKVKWQVACYVLTLSLFSFRSLSGASTACVSVRGGGMQYEMNWVNEFIRHRNGGGGEGGGETRERERHTESGGEWDGAMTHASTRPIGYVQDILCLFLAGEERGEERVRVTDAAWDGRKKARTQNWICVDAVARELGSLSSVKLGKSEMNEL